MKKIVLLLALFGLAFQTTSCKSKKAQDDTEIVENADVEKIEAEDSALVAMDNTANSVGPVDDSLQAALGETSTTAATDPALTTTDVAVTETAPTDAAAEIAAAPTLDEQNLGTPAPMDSTTTAASEPTLESTGGITETPIAESNTDAAMAQGITETPVLSEPPAVTASETSTVTKTASAKPSGGGSLKKISDTTPYQFGEGWVNTVYISRPKEKLKDISQKIYGMDKTKELKKINSFLAARSPKGGDKIYYVSPNRPADSMKTISFYEDTGMIAETYVAQKGDNLKKVSKELLGYSDAYKEVWTTNPVESKTALVEGETLRYWKANTSVAPTTTVAANTTSFPTGGGAQVIDSANQLPSQPIAQEMTPPPPPPTELPPPPPADMAPPADQLAQNTPPATTDLPPPPPPPADTMSTGTTDAAAMTPPPPPPPAEDLAAAPVEPKKKMVTPNMEEEEANSEGMNSDTTMMLGGVVVLCSLLAFALIRRNKKKKEIEMASMSETNVGT